MVHVKTVRMNAFFLLMGCVLGQRSLSGADMDLDEIVHNVKSGAYKLQAHDTKKQKIVSKFGSHSRTS